MKKKEIRSNIRDAARKVSCEQHHYYSDNICRSVLSHPEVATADVVIAYWPLSDEVDVRPVIRHLHEEHVRVLLPKVISDTEMVLCQYECEENLVSGSLGVLEPMGDTVDVQTIEGRVVVLVPGRAFDAEGHRLGRGKGYYDRFFEDIKNYGKHIERLYKLAVCYPYQLLPSVPAEPHDVLMDEVLTRR